MGGGEGTRPYPHPVDLPEPLVEIAGRPALHHVAGEAGPERRSPWLPTATEPSW